LLNAQQKKAARFLRSWSRSRYLIGVTVLGALLTSCSDGGGSASAGAVLPVSANDVGTVPTATPIPTTTGLAKDGDWANPATWGGKVPTDGDVVEIPNGKTVTLSGSTAQLGGLKVDGTLQFSSSADVSLTSRWILVHGSLRAGSEAAPYTRKATITLTGTDKTQNLTMDMGMGMNMAMGTKLIGVMGGGALELHGENRLSWTQIVQTANVGATNITVSENPSTWRKGDQIVIAPSGFEADEYDLVTITAVNGNSVSFEPALQHAHWGSIQTFEGKALDQRAAVGLLTRNITIRGAEDSNAINFGGHVMAMKDAKIRVSGVEFFKMGQRGIKGRYPLHWHLAGNLAGDYAKNNSIHDSFQRAIVVHGTNDALIEGNVAFNITNHAFVWAEDGNEERNQFIKNLAIFNKSPAEEDFAFKLKEPNPLFGNSDQAEFRSASFWGRSFNHTIKGNIAAGSVNGFGFFFDRFSPSTLGSSEMAGLVFENNIAHSNYRENAGGLASEIYPEATFGHGLMVTTGLQSESPHVFKKFTSYKNYGGAWLEDRSTELHDSVIADNGVGIYVHRGVIDDVMIIGKSSNAIGNKDKPLKGGFGSGAQGAIVVPSSHGGARAPIIKNATVINHDDAAYVVDVSDLGASAQVNQLRLINSKSQPIYFHEVNPYEYTFYDHGVLDLIGNTNAGVPTVWAGRRSPLVSSNCRSSIESNAIACPLSSSILLRYNTPHNRFIRMVKEDGSTLGLGQSWHFDRLVASEGNSGWIQNGAQYDVIVDKSDSFDAKVGLSLEHSIGKTVEFAWTVKGMPSMVKQNNIVLKSASSLNTLRSGGSAYFYDSVIGKLYVRVLGGDGIQVLSIDAPFAPSNMAFMGRPASSVPSLTAGINRIKYNESSPSSDLRQALRGSGEAVTPLSIPVLDLNQTANEDVLATADGTQVYRGFFEAKEDGIYILSSGGANGNIDVFVGPAWITGTRQNTWSVVQEPGSNDRSEAGMVTLRKGWHPVTVVFGRNQLQANYDSYSARFYVRVAPPSNHESFTPIRVFR
jgi:hypothetical protein